VCCERQLIVNVFECDSWLSIGLKGRDMIAQGNALGTYPQVNILLATLKGLVNLAIPVPVLGIVGGIGSGKSYVSSLFARLGAFVIDADRIGHKVLTYPEVLRAIQERWGSAVFEYQLSTLNPQPGSLNSQLTPQLSRKKLGAIVFADAKEKAKLEALVHPLIRADIERQIYEASRDPAIKLVILDAAIMLETGWKDACQAVIFVDASEAVRLQRVAKRGWDSGELKKREASQWPLEQKKSLCQHIIPNEGDEVFTQTLVNDLFIRYAR
jgi:dephospho-CoA kinase